jgi:hypothetical protein
MTGMDVDFRLRWDTLPRADVVPERPRGLPRPAVCVLRAAEALPLRLGGPDRLTVAFARTAGARDRAREGLFGEGERPHRAREDLPLFAGEHPLRAGVSPPPAGALHAVEDELHVVDHDCHVVDHDLPHAVSDLPSFGCSDRASIGHSNLTTASVLQKSW